MPKWLVVERFENWLLDERQGFKSFGLRSKNSRAAQEIRRGDLLLVYVCAPASAFADVREVVSEGLLTREESGGYHLRYDYALQTRSLLLLEREEWLTMKSVHEQLEFARGRDRRGLMQSPLRKLSTADGNLLLDAMRLRVASNADEYQPIG